MTNAALIDISTFQTVTPPLAGLDGVFIRASYGTFTDPRYAQHYSDVRAAGKIAMAYHFGYDPSSGASIAAQVDHFLSVAAGADFWWLDEERSNFTMTDADAAAFIKAMHDRGYPCGLYHSQSGYPDVGQDARWVAKWSTTPPSIPWDFWQDADTYLGTGKDGDHDYFHGDSAALAAWLGGWSVKYISAGGLAEASTYVVDLVVGQQLYGFDGTPVVKVTTAGAVPYLGQPDGRGGYLCVLVHTTAVYKDGISRPTILVAHTPSARKIGNAVGIIDGLVPQSQVAAANAAGIVEGEATMKSKAVTQAQANLVTVEAL